MYYGISLSKTTKNQRYYNLYLNSLKKYFEKKGISDPDAKINIVRKIWADEVIVNGDVNDIDGIVDMSNINFIKVIWEVYNFCLFP